MKYERLTTDKPQSNKDFLLNFAFVKDGEVYLHGMGDDGEEIRLCDYIALRATSEKGCERTPQDILDGACNECHCELAALNIAAIQAAELRNRLADLEDKIESGQLVELPAPIGSDLWEIEMPHYKDSNGKSWTVCTYKGAKVKKLKYKLSLSNVGMVVDGHYFVSKSQAEARLKEPQGE